MEKNKREMQEAITAGERALDSLFRARERLKSARGFGMLDLFGGGFFTDLLKHNKMNEAARCMEEAKDNLKIFQRELSDLCLSVDLRMEVGGFLSFADFFFDGLVADYLVQSKIASAREQVEDAIVVVTDTLDVLKRSF